MTTIEREIDKKVKNVDINPSDAKKEAGNYKKAKVTIKGMKITIENQKGSKRYYDGDKYNVMKNHYGYFNRAVGYDGDQVDVFLGKDFDSDKVFVIDQKKENGKFDESKVMLGFKTSKDAKSAYLSNYSKGWNGFMAITEVDIEKFKKWLYDGKKQRKAFSDYKNISENIMNKKVIKLTESDIKKIVKNTVARILSEGKEEYKPTQEDWDSFGEFASSDEPDLVNDEIGAVHDAENEDEHPVYPLDADDEFEGFTRDYMQGEEYGRNLIAKSKDIEGIKAELERKEDNGTITPFELGLLDVIGQDQDLIMEYDESTNANMRAAKQVGNDEFYRC